MNNHEAITQFMTILTAPVPNSIARRNRLWIQCNYRRIITLKTELVRIGNSRGIRIPKPFIEQCRLGSAVELHIEHDYIVISRERRPRDGWNEAFQAAGFSSNDELLLDKIESNKFDRKEWDW